MMKYTLLAILGLMFGIVIGIVLCVMKYDNILYCNRIRFIYLDEDTILMIDPCDKESSLMYLEGMNYDEAKLVKYVYCFNNDTSYRVIDNGKKFDLIETHPSDEENE